MFSLKFKNNDIKEMYLSNPEITRICESFKAETCLDEILLNKSLNINDKNLLCFITENSWDDLAVVADIIGLTYVFSIYLPQEKILKVKSCLGNLDIYGDQINFCTGIYSDVNNFYESEIVYKKYMWNNYNFTDVVYIQGEFFQ